MNTFFLMQNIINLFCSLTTGNAQQMTVLSTGESISYTGPDQWPIFNVEPLRSFYLYFYLFVHLY